MSDSAMLTFLTRKPETDPALEADFEARFQKNIGPAFRELDQDIDRDGHSEYLLKGGRGSLKSSYIGMRALKTLRRTPRGNALVIRKVAATMRDTVYAQILWAMDILGVYEDWDCTVSPMKMINKKTGQEIAFRGWTIPGKSSPSSPGADSSPWCGLRRARNTRITQRSGT